MFVSVLGSCKILVTDVTVLFCVLFSARRAGNFVFLFNL